MSKTVNVGASQAQIKLMAALGETIMRHTGHSPMTEEEVVTVLGFCLGCAIGQGQNRKDRRALREAAIANLDYGIDRITSQPSGVILPDGVVVQ